ncbi:MAG: thioesterase family protein [Rubricoccaceae bacterium]
MPHTTRLSVRWSDLDALGHLNNAAYLTLCEEARIDALTTLFPAWWTKTYSPVVASASVQFKRPITAPGPVLVTVEFDPPGRSSLRMTYTIVTEAEPDGICAESDSVLVWVDLATESSMPIPEGLRNALVRSQ